MNFVRWMASPIGRAPRVFFGLALIASGVRVSAMTGWVLAAIGFVPLLAGAGDLCLLAPLLGYPMSGRQIRESH